MKKSACLLLVLVLGFLSSACSNPNEDRDEIRAFVRVSEREPRKFTVQVVSEDQAYSVRAAFEDELRYGMVLGSNGHELMDYVVRDDALAVRLRDVGFGSRLGNVLGDPVVDAALKEGRWVVDPAGAPPLIRTDVAAGGESFGDPFRDAGESIRFIEQAIGQARQVKEFTLDDVEYRSALDPWRYPSEDRGEVRYDFRRPFLPTSEVQTLGSQGDIGPAQFRKLVVFVEGRRIREICSLVDIDGHEEFRELRRRGLGSNPFLARLLRRIKQNETAIPIEERYSIVRVDYPDKVSVTVPSDAVTGKLETFQTALTGAFEAGVLRPSGRQDMSACRRRETGATSN